MTFDGATQLALAFIVGVAVGYALRAWRSAVRRRRYYSW
jgi:hypothetical protein